MQEKTEKIIYQMLIENTGIHMCDSGGKDGRNWQRNQKRTLKDFQNDPVITKDDDLITKSLFHHLSESCEYLPDQTNMLKTWINTNKYDWIKNKDGRSNEWNDVQEFMEKYTHQGKKINCLYTYNEDNVLSQDIQFLYGGDIYESDIIALCIHNGCDARGGLTDYKFFKIDYDTFLNWTPESYEEELVA